MSTVRVIVLGSSAVFPLPRTRSNVFEDYADIIHYREKFSLHDDPLCLSAARGGKDRRTRSSLAIETDGHVMLFDAGPDIVYQLNRSSLRPAAVCITHDHADAIAGLPTFGHIPIFRETAGTVTPKQAFDFFGLHITPFRVVHAKNVPCVGYAVEFGDGITKKKLVYMTDIASLRGTKTYVEQADIVFADGSILERSLHGHLAMIQQLPWYRRWNVKQVIFTHIGHATLPHDDLLRFLKRRSSLADVAYDGMQFTYE